MELLSPLNLEGTDSQGCRGEGATPPGTSPSGHGKVRSRHRTCQVFYSEAAQLGGVVGPHYAASKASIHGPTHSYAALLAKEGITLNTIALAVILTEMVTGKPPAEMSHEKLPGRPTLTIPETRACEMGQRGL
jgi:NAD(P)-dependent dehydrogenase (short-subunit alcohol dehydrogenase family)